MVAPQFDGAPRRLGSRVESPLGQECLGEVVVGGGVAGILFGGGAKARSRLAQQANATATTGS